MFLTLWRAEFCCREAVRDGCLVGAGLLLLLKRRKVTGVGGCSFFRPCVLPGGTGLCCHTQSLVTGTGVALKEENAPFWRPLGRGTSGKARGAGANLPRFGRFFSLPGFLSRGLLALTFALL